MTNLTRARKEMAANDPPVKVGQVWVGRKTTGEVLRRVHLLAPYPEIGIQRHKKSDNEKLWIYEELPGGIFHTEHGRISIFPELNLRYGLSLEKDSYDD